MYDRTVGSVVRQNHWFGPVWWFYRTTEANRKFGCTLLLTSSLRSYIRSGKKTIWCRVKFIFILDKIEIKYSDKIGHFWPVLDILVIFWTQLLFFFGQKLNLLGHNFTFWIVLNKIGHFWTLVEIFVIRTILDIIELGH